MGLFKDWGVTNITLKRKVKRRLIKKQLKKRKEPENYTGRTYTDYLEYKTQNPHIVTTEMDTVYNNQSGPYIQTFIFENTSFMIGIWICRASLNKSMKLCKKCGIFHICDMENDFKSSRSLNGPASRRDTSIL